MSKLTQLLVSLAAVTLVGAACGSDEASDPTDVPIDQDELRLDTTEAPAPATDAPAPATEAPAPATDAPAPATDAPVETDVATSDQGLQVTSVDFTTGVAVITNNGDRDYDLAGHWICQRPNYAELPATVLAPGDSVEASLGGFSDAGGEAAVYTSSDFGDPAAIVAYVGWGSGGGRNSVAEDAGIWTGPPVQPTGDSITLTGEPGSADGWT